MIIIDFTHEHIEQAKTIAKMNYEEERNHVTALPQIVETPDLTWFADNKLGVVALDNEKIVGFMCYYPPIDDAWGTTNAKGTFSPIHAHGAIFENREKIYSNLYQATAQRLVKDGIISHAIALYAHDELAIKSFFYNGFGLRCIDAIRSIDEIQMIGDIECEYCELPKDEWNNLLDLQNMLITHLSKSPTLIPHPTLNQAEFSNLIETSAKDGVRYFVAKIDGKYIAYIKISPEGENFACDDESMLNICGACCLPEYRGTGIYNNLLAHLITTLKDGGYTRLGVDFESFNPTARGFWMKHFTPYTNSVVRRIDDKITMKQGDNSRNENQ